MESKLFHNNSKTLFAFFTLNSGAQRIVNETFSQDGSVGRHDLLLHTATSKLQLKYRTTIIQEHKKLSWIEVWQLWNRGEWKSDNYEIKETTPIQTGRRGTDTEHWMRWSHTHVDKNSGGISQEREVPNLYQAPSTGFQCQEDKFPQLLATKIMGRTSGQDGGIGRHTVPPGTTKRKTTTNLKTKNN